MTIRFDEKVAIVTGAGGGLGRVYAHKLAERGAKVVVNDLGGPIDKESPNALRAADAVVKEIMDMGGEAIASFDSVADAEGAAKIVDTALGTYGKLDILINNAGNLFQAPFTDMPIEQYQALINVHLFGAIYMTRAALEPMRTNGYGRVVYTSSGSGLVGFNGQAVYGATKTAMVGFQNCLLLEEANRDILFNTLVPTADSRMSAGILPEHLRGFLTPENVSPAVVWMASDACNVNGKILVAGGGFFGAVELVRSKGVLIDPTRPITVEMYDEKFAELSDMRDATPYMANMTNLENRLKERGFL